MPEIQAKRRSLAVTIVGTLLLLGTAGCTGGSAPPAAGASSTSPTPRGTQVAGPTPTTSQTGPAANPTPTTSATASPSSTSGGAVQNLTISTSVRAELVATFVAHLRVPPSDVTGTEPGSVYYAYDPQSGRYWAIARFVPAATDPLRVLVNFQDGGNIGLFWRLAAGSWHIGIAGIPPICGELRFFPARVLIAWSIPGHSPIC